MPPIRSSFVLPDCSGTVADYERQGRAPKSLTSHYWQVDDPIGEKFGYVEGMKLTTASGVIRSLVDNVSRNGNYMPADKFSEIAWAFKIDELELKKNKDETILPGS